MNFQPDSSTLSEDEKKVTCIYETYEKNMQEQAYRMLQDPHEAELAVQASLRKIVHSLNLFDLSNIKNRSYSHLFMMIVKHTAIDDCRKKLK